MPFPDLATIGRIVEQFAFLQARGFHEPSVEFEESEDHVYLEFRSERRYVRVSFLHPWRTVQFVELPPRGSGGSRRMIEIEPDFSRLPVLAQARGRKRWRRVALLFRGEEVRREHGEAVTQLVTRVRDEFADFVPLPE